MYYFLYRAPCNVYTITSTQPVSVTISLYVSKNDKGDERVGVGVGAGTS